MDQVHLRRDLIQPVETRPKPFKKTHRAGLDFKIRLILFFKSGLDLLNYDLTQSDQYIFFGIVWILSSMT